MTTAAVLYTPTLPLWLVEFAVTDDFARRKKLQSNDVAAIELSLGVVVVEASDLFQAKIHGKAEFERTAKYPPVGRRKLQVSGATLDDIRAKDAVSL